MDFQQFLQYVPNLIPVELPAETAHAKMAPLERIQALKNLDINAKNPRIAAVMMLFYPKNEKTHLILIVRNAYNGVHSSQIAFPGGKYEITDRDYQETALRETSEEIGVLPEKIEIIKHFTPMYIPPSNFLVHPYLGIAKEELSFYPDAREVASIIELPLSVFLDDEIMIETTLSTSYGNDILVPAFYIQNHIVWGATAMILSELRDVLKTTFAENS
ncbi:NUDIX hydrolase [Flavobacterium johnsoniae]|jgi:8-oxo-dGTP pyrophosphatase MutT (NUDIX family)|uniref:NUDIX hydrolase n=1 Tax=Flavobacterium johnsoniae (strain ATCC 17061 / DSM 2064 / JCM 8514 / BCRC 14874 / CCUG 350202 / NBRC 14942 / NCIMB 11054 / UW101) TaxID=376686 RepID=A5FH97_FLAJ1|nr:CoA pyrophosphatase [Flavobacterium johnsoniae]ABQ05420.1 NUDIX hydrolase [Flavobacterium johnsoniae UW101]OXE96841.1 coenzyme A pyrophosphatase [Flavobacterium johnsoniae UW101]WQG82777.1 CoA pyrophosphatase [Flavobacterium johnsoniae UW101]SHL57437.1 NUDIX domain-containing protein [Flavobacterium johnsoniae]